MSQPEPSAPSLARTSARGLAWMSINSLGSKVAGLAAQLLLARLLLTSDYGLIGTAYWLAGLAGLLTSIGLDDILVQRQKNFDRWANSVFWLSLTCGLIAAVAMIDGALIYQRLRPSGDHAAHLVLSLSALLAINSPLTMLATVPTVRMRIDLRFKSLSMIGFISNVCQSAFSVFLAWRGYGAYSFIWSRLAASLVTLLFSWHYGRARVYLRLQFRLWKYLSGITSMAFTTRVAGQLVSFGDYLTLSMLWPLPVQGIYFFAFNLSTQTSQLLVMNLNSVLFPALCKLQDDPERQTRAMLRSVRLLASIAVPLCFLQAALAGPGIHLFFSPRYDPDKWHDAIRVLQALSIGAAFSALGWPSGALLPAQGRFRAHMQLAVCMTAVFFMLVIPGAYFGKALGTAVAVAVWYALYASIALYVAVRPSGAGARMILHSVQGSLAAAAISVGGAYACSKALPIQKQNGWIALTGIALLSVAMYPPLLRALDLQAWMEFSAAFRKLVSKLIHRPTSTVLSTP